MEIGLFQLENLTISRSPFTLLDIRESRVELPKELENLLKSAHAVTAAAVLEFLEKKGGPKDQPILLLDESGRSSGVLAESLESAGYKNVYIVERGVEGLLSEL